MLRNVTSVMKQKEKKYHNWIWKQRFSEYGQIMWFETYDRLTGSRQQEALRVEREQFLKDVYTKPVGGYEYFDAE